MNNQSLQLEMWQKTNDSLEQMVGTTNLPLQQFYVAFNDHNLFNHLTKVKVHRFEVINFFKFQIFFLASSNFS